MPFPSLAKVMLASLALPHTLASTSSTASPSSSAVPLRIMALGASVTFGYQSTTGNGYRKDLEDLLVMNGSEVDYVGSNRNGNWDDDEVEATSGFVIGQIMEAAEVAVPKYKPNLVLIDAGTNNCNAGGLVPDAGKNVTFMIEGIYQNSPGATVVLATILVNPDEKQDACRIDVNSQLTNSTMELQASGKKIVLVDMRGPGGPLVSDLRDGRHPNDGGYVKMANIWFGGVQEAVAKGFVVHPVEMVDGGATVTSMMANSTQIAGSINTATAVKSEGVKARCREHLLGRWFGGVVGVWGLLLWT